MEEKGINKVQEYFINEFSKDLTNKDFEELKRIVIDWLFEKAKGDTKLNKY